MKKLITWLVVIVLIGVGIYFFTRSSPSTPPANPDQNATTTPPVSSATTTTQNANETVIGTSVDGNKIIAYHYGTGDKEILFFGGIHGGYEWNTVLLAYQMMDYLKANPDVIPKNLKVTIIPVLNPDGLKKIVGTTGGGFTKADVPALIADTVSGRFNSNNVDLSRNFDCNWKANGVWQSKTVSGGTEAFSEPESLAFKNYIETSKPTAVVGWYSSGGGVYSSSCGGSVLPETRTLTNAYAKASGYPAHDQFDAYAVTGDIVDWLAKQKISAISILLTTHSDVELSNNLAGVKAILNYYAK